MDVRCVCFEFDRKVVWHKKKVKRTCCYLDFPILNIINACMTIIVGLQLLAFKYIFAHNSYKCRILYIKVTSVYKIQINILEYSQNLREKYKKVTKNCFIILLF